MIDLADLAADLRRVTVEVTDDGRSLGSGVLWPPGFVVTNAHVVRRPHMRARLLDGRCLTGEVVARDAASDLALLRVGGTGLPVARVAPPAATRVGSLVVAIGHPFGVRGALTAGIVHAVRPDRILADVRLAPGNSGGPLADATGRVVGL